MMQFSYYIDILCKVSVEIMKSNVTELTVHDPYAMHRIQLVHNCTTKLYFYTVEQTPLSVESSYYTI